MDDLFSYSYFASSRAVDEDDDYQLNEKRTDLIRAPVVRWSPKARRELFGSNGIQCSTLLVAIGTAAAEFVQVHLLAEQPSETIGIVCSGMGGHKASTLGQEAFTDDSCFIHRLLNSPQVIVIQCKANVATEQLFSWTEQVLSRLCSASTSVIVLSASLITDHKSPVVSSDLCMNFQRCLRSSKCRIQSICPSLEQPNIVTGLSAQMLSYCQIRRLSCILYLCYADAFCCPSEAMQDLRGLLSGISFKEVNWSNLKTDQELPKSCQAHSINSALYI